MVTVELGVLSQEELPWSLPWNSLRSLVKQNIQFKMLKWRRMHESWHNKYSSKMENMKGRNPRRLFDGRVMIHVNYNNKHTATL